MPVSKARIGAVINRRINAAMRRGDDARAGQLKSMRANLNNGCMTAGQVLIDLQIYTKVVHKVPTVIRMDRKQLRGGL